MVKYSDDCPRERPRCTSESVSELPVMTGFATQYTEAGLSLFGSGTQKFGLTLTR